MKFEIEAINHVCLVVKDSRKAEAFYVDVLGLERHHKVSSWLVLNETSTLHLVTIPEASANDSLYQEVQHLALQVADLDAVLEVLIDGGRQPFQMDFTGKEKPVDSVKSPLDFGLGTLFVYDDDGNLIEFVQMNRGVFTEDMRPIIPAATTSTKGK